MRSHLTRNVFRRLLSGKDLLAHCSSYPWSIQCRGNLSKELSVTRSTRRTLFGFTFKKAARQPRDPSITPGLPIMMEFSHMEKIGARPPPTTQLRDSWRAFFEYKHKKKEVVNILQAEIAWRIYEYLKKINSTNSAERLTIQDLRTASSALRRLPNDKLDLHKQFARALYYDIREKETGPFKTMYNFEWFIEILSLTGDTTEAKTLLQSYILERNDILERNETLHQSNTHADTKKMWIFILEGFSLEKNEEGLMSSFEAAKKDGLIFNPVVHRIMTTFFAEKNDVEATKRWYKEPIVGGADTRTQPRAQTLAVILQFCLRNGELEWCKQIFKEAISLEPTKGTWDVIFLWAAGARGKGVEDVERMIEVMIRRNPENENMRPNINTINGLVQLAMSKNDPYLAERYLSLGHKFGIRPNTHTFVLQINYRTDANDLRGAHAAYEALQSEEILDEEDLPPINKYIRALCASQNPDIKLVNSILNDLDERGRRLEAATVTALSLLYLDRQQIDDLVDVLQTNIYHYTLSERGSIRDAFVHFICDRDNSTVKAWDAYNILRQFFNETSVEQRTQIMNSFFKRRRCDMACHAFGHMRQNTIPDRKPTLDTYITCLEGIAKLSDREYLDVIHNMLKLDSTIEPNTKLYNALMLAYTSVCEGKRALSFWTDITNLYEGPSYKSLEIVFWACQETNFGSENAREIWSKMMRMDVDVTGPVFAEYVGSLSKDGHWEEVKSMVNSMEQKYGLKPDVRTLGTIYNCLPGEETKLMMQSWSMEYYPEVWAGVRKFGSRMVRDKLYPEIRMKQYYLKRDFKAS
ncbi:Complex I intermediate-associated protein 84 [Podosphaera aphanis]|nr:Complex I intermediate-associated protein 84 [Podosphaera aphanis]